ncbi:bifunctional DNA primase/polymerase [Bacillus sp. AFS088145]|uniref:bifunctional DNA primase/polymerase n=1 Tax=Bacillus sp. AFS088145 TaxID=2033514 RepID=UPI0015CF04C1|nr:bifunctional DNA primase/polymerase [Bacillus sp. AFS088145]
MNISRLDYALLYFDNGLVPIPTCWTKDGQCACPINHTGKQVGKAPLVRYKQTKIDRHRITYWFRDLYPNANIAIDLEASNLVVIDADSAAAVAEIEAKLEGMTIPTVQTNRGKHYYFKPGDTTPPYKTTQKGLSRKIDIMSTGLMTVPPSTHASGHVYKWITTPKACANGIPTVPGDVEQYLLNQHIEQQLKQPRNIYEANSIIREHCKALEGIKKIDLETLHLSEPVKDIIRYGEASKYYQERKYLSRSDALFGIMISCVKHGLSDEVICSLLMDEENAISEKVIEKGNGKPEQMLEWLTKLQLPKAKMKANIKIKPKKEQKKESHHHNDPDSNTISKGNVL